MSGPIDLTPYDVPDPSAAQRWGDAARAVHARRTTVEQRPAPAAAPVALPRRQQWAVAALTGLVLAHGVAWALLVPALKVLGVLTWWAVRLSATLLLWTVIGLLVVCTLGMLRPE